MPSYNLTVLGLHVSFKAEAGPERVQEAKNLVERRFSQLHFHAERISKEKLLIFLALGLADELLQTNQDLASQRARVEEILEKIESLDCADNEL